MTAAPDVDPWEMNQAAYGTGGVTTRTVNGHRDVFLDNPTHYTQVGVRLDWGGSVVFFGLANQSGTNVLDANDTGRELQLAIYDPERQMQGCAYNASCVSNPPAACPSQITYLGWNPVQGGDECNHGSPSSYAELPDGLEVVVHPLQWNPDWDAPDCRQSACPAAGIPVDVTYVMQFRFLTQHVVQLKMEVQSQESFDHVPTGQEFPTLYVAHGQAGTPDLPLLLDASGAVVSIDQPANDGFFVRNFESPAPWVTWQNALRTYGVGLAMDQGVRSFQGWRGEATYFHNVRANFSFGLKGGQSVRGMAYLALGAEETVRTELTTVLSQRAPFGVVDVPAAGAPTVVSAGTELPVSGWVLDDEPVTTLQVDVDGVMQTSLALGSARPDVCAVYPGYPDCPNAGFAGTLATAGWTPCQHLVRVRAVDAKGNVRVLGERVVEVP